MRIAFHIQAIKQNRRFKDFFTEYLSNKTYYERFESMPLSFIMNLLGLLNLDYKNEKIKNLYKRKFKLELFFIFICLLFFFYINIFWKV